MGQTPRYAIIHVQYEPGSSEAWPIVERVPGGWQSGAHHYPDDAVLDVHPLALSDDPRPATAGEDAERLRALWSQPYVPHSDVDWVRYYIAEKWPELRAALDALTAVTPAPDEASGR